MQSRIRLAKKRIFLSFVLGLILGRFLPSQYFNILAVALFLLIIAALYKHI